MPKKPHRQHFIETARELGCDPDDPRVADVLKAMATQLPKTHADEQPKRRKLDKKENKE